MPSPIQKNGTPLSSIFAPYLAGTTKAAATGIYENGNDLCNLYAPLSYGSAAAASGIQKNGADLNTIFAAINTTTYPLGFNGVQYSSSATRGSAGVSLTMKSDGTWAVSAGSGTPTSGSWLNFGGTVSDYTVEFDETGFTSGAVPGGGTTSYRNDAPSPTSLTSSQTISCTASATTVSTTASNGGTVTVKLYKNGALVSTTQCGFGADASGN